MFTCSASGGWVYFSNGTKLWVEPNEDYLSKLPPEERKREDGKNAADQRHLAQMYGHFMVDPTTERIDPWADRPKLHPGEDMRLRENRKDDHD